MMIFEYEKGLFRDNNRFPGLPEGIRTFSKPFWTNLGTCFCRPLFDSKRERSLSRKENVVFREDKLVFSKEKRVSRKEVFGFSEKSCVSQKRFCVLSKKCRSSPRSLVFLGINVALCLHVLHFVCICCVLSASFAFVSFV